ncbi:NACHT domain-containing protein [Corynebacterium ammoniagenes]|uniref:ATP-binding protein n=1 Tax=Corynebacterium ammoniagenes DSM 20306 TaxID=649754 RepID=A0ABP2IH32_CORAM|nr:hypothetical protein [Corynebacterium ammoniagenes]APT82169.1 hypothetical protein CAMM_04290 [Corynebacterium ammoniagenes DSM 20306]AQS73266.1 hypothetical protein CA40472_04615 [Corynebacterium ammoniagenes]EFG80272.1 hypothetical protein HMPREF0281_02366 [Corynebacterium ammoniagenes DSM 20306]
MSESLPKIDFKQIRAHGNPGSQADGFEALAAILFEQMIDNPEDVLIERFGNPDGGREGKATFPNGDVWAWQAKFVFNFDSKLANKIKESFLRAIDHEPKLKKYSVMLPIDLPASDSEGTKSANSKWRGYVERWQELARENGLEVEFDLVNSSKMEKLLTRHENSGRLAYWFNRDTLTLESQRQKLDDTIAKVLNRYQPEVHVDVRIESELDAVSGAPAYFERWRNILLEIQNLHVNDWVLPLHLAAKHKAQLSQLTSSITRLSSVILHALEKAPHFEDRHKIQASLPDTNTAVDILSDLPHVSHHEIETPEHKLRDRLNSAIQLIQSVEQFVESPASQAAYTNELLIVGSAGVGKTHLLCEISKQRVSDSLPTLLLLGQDFSNQNLLAQIPKNAEMSGTIDNLLSLLNAAGEASNSKALLIIDAVNESENPSKWRSEIAALRTKARRFKNIGLVLSCRSEYLEYVIGEHDLPTIEHFGLEDSTEKAIRRYAKKFELDLTSFPPMNPELANPLFLYLACEALSTLGTSRFNLGTAGLATIYEAFVESINEKLSHSTRCNYDPKENLVQDSINQLVRLSHDRFEYQAAKSVISNILPNRNWNEHLMRGLIDEGILISAGPNHLAFGFQRLGDIALARSIASKSIPEIEDWLSLNKDNFWQLRGMMASLAILVPELHQVEFCDFEITKTLGFELRKDFVESLALRDIASISTRTIQVLEECLLEELLAEEAWGQLVRISCVPRHPLNAHWLHSYLSQMDLAERDSTWSVWLHYKASGEESTPVSTLIDWAWPSDFNRIARSSRESNELACIALSWFLTTSDRRVRDNATKALVALGEFTPNAFQAMLKQTLNSNDPYIVERLVSASCGIILRNSTTEVTHSIASIVADYVTEVSPTHLLTRDYLKRIFQMAEESGWQAHKNISWAPTQWPIQATSFESIEKLAKNLESPYSSIWYSLSGMGDFGNKILDTAIRSFDLEDPKDTLSLCQRIIFDRVRELGWLPETFDKIDKYLRHGRSQSPVERIGKKYQWIGFYEVLGILSDHFKIKDFNGVIEPYSHAKQIVWRDIDMTVLAQTSEPGTGSDWFSPQTANFPSNDASRWPHNLDCVPDPLELLATKSPDGQEWVALLSYPSWNEEEQPFKPEQPQRDAWMHIHAYLVPNKSASKLREWAQSQDWFEKWMPSFAEPSNLLLGSHPNDPEWSGASGTIDDDDYPSLPDQSEMPPRAYFESLNKQFGYPLFDIARTQDPPKSEPNERNIPMLRELGLIQCGAQYSGLGTETDQSSNRKVWGFVPSHFLFEKLGINHGKDFVWYDDSGVAVFDPSVNQGGPKTLLLNRRLVKELYATGYSLFWTVLVGHDQFERNGFYPHDYQWVTGSASYILHDDSISKIDSRAEIRYRGSEDFTNVAWGLKESENSDQ